MEQGELDAGWARYDLSFAAKSGQAEYVVGQPIWGIQISCRLVTVPVLRFKSGTLFEWSINGGSGPGEGDVYIPTATTMERLRRLQ